MEGRYEAQGRAVPIVGFPFLRNPRTHISNAEIEHLGSRINAFLAASATLAR